MSADYCQAGGAGVVSHTNESNTAIAKEGVSIEFYRNRIEKRFSIEFVNWYEHISLGLYQA